MLATVLAITVAATGTPAEKPVPVQPRGCQTRSCVKRVRVKKAERLRAKRQRLWIKKEIRKVTPYRCGFGRSAIPCSIVYCESKGSWSAYNPSGALSRYQLLGKPVPWPVRTMRDKLAHHRYAYNLYAGGAGASHWAQCL